MDEKKTDLLIWNLQIPVMITCAENESSCIKIPACIKPPAFFLLVNRIHYISLYFAEIHEFFAKFMASATNLEDVWLETQGFPVSW